MRPALLFPVLLLFAFGIPASGQPQSPLAAQTPIQPPIQAEPAGTAALPEFEVASVKVNKSGKGEMIRLEPGSFVAEDATLQRLMMVAYKVRDFQVSGGPSWIYSERYDIEAKTDGPSGADQMFLMLQKLLEDRFELRFHYDSKEGPVYLLTIAKGGIKMPQAACVPFDPNRFLPHSAVPDQARSNQCDVITLHNTGLDRTLDAKGISMADSTGPTFSRSLTGQLSLALGRPVIDKTGLTGTFDIHLRWTADSDTQGSAAYSNPQSATDSTGTSIFTAVQEQLGLKLESRKGPVDVLVIDHVEELLAN